MLAKIEEAKSGLNDHSVEIQDATASYIDHLYHAIQVTENAAQSRIDEWESDGGT